MTAANSGRSFDGETEEEDEDDEDSSLGLSLIANLDDGGEADAFDPTTCRARVAKVASAKFRSSGDADGRRAPQRTASKASDEPEAVALNCCVDPAFPDAEDNSRSFRSRISDLDSHRARCSVFPWN